MTDDAIREVHGVQCRKIMAIDCPIASIIVREREDFIEIDRLMAPRKLTPWQARYLAAKLYRLSRRIRQRVDVPQ